MTYVIRVELDGRTYPLNQCVWLRYDGDGHCVGMLVGDGATSDESCHEEFTEDEDERCEELASGYTHVLFHRDNPVVAAAYKCQWQQCHHINPQDPLPLEL